MYHTFVFFSSAAPSVPCFGTTGPHGCFGLEISCENQQTSASSLAFIAGVWSVFIFYTLCLSLVLLVLFSVGFDPLGFRSYHFSRSLHSHLYVPFDQSWTSASGTYLLTW